MRRFPLPQYIQLYPLSRCNQNCGFCFNPPSGAPDMHLSDAMRLLDIMQDNGISELDIMGGEPFLLPWMGSYLPAALKRGIRVNISTNGSLPEAAAGLQGADPEMINIGISIEGSCPEKHNAITGSGNFDRALKCISDLVSYGLDPLVKTVLNRQTLDDINNIIVLLRRSGIRRYYLIHMDMFSKAPADMDISMSYTEFISHYDRIASEHGNIAIQKVNASCFEKGLLPEGIRCAGGVKKLSVMSDGSVFPCNLLQHFNDQRLGNIFEQDLASIWEGSGLGLFRNFVTNRCEKKDCRNHGSCTGGCPAHALFHGYDTGGTDIRCR